MRYTVLIGILILSLLSACAKPTPPPLPPEEIVAKAVARTKSLTGFHFVIERSGAPAYLDADNTLALSRVEGDFVAPDRAQGQVRIIAPGLFAGVKFLSIGERFWETNVLTGAWEECAPGACFNPAVLFDAKIGLQPILESDLSDLKFVGNEELEDMPGKLLYSVTGKLKGERAYEMSWGMIGPETMSVHLWVAPETFEFYRIQIDEPSTKGGESTLWKVDFLSFDKKADIQPPALPTATP